MMKSVKIEIIKTKIVNYDLDPVVYSGWLPGYLHNRFREDLEGLNKVSTQIISQNIQLWHEFKK